MEFFEFLFYFFIGVGIYKLFRAPAKRQQEVMAEFKKHLETITHVVEVEEHGSTYYWFDRDSGEFLAQGKTYDDIVNILKSRFPNHFFYLNNEMLLHGPDWQLKKFEV